VLAWSRVREEIDGRGLAIATLLQILAVSAIVMGLSQTLAKERIFAPLRRQLGGMKTWVGYLVSCPWCVSHWIAFVLVPLTGLYPVRVVVAWKPLAWALEWFLASILITVVAAFFRVVFWLVDEEQVLLRRRQRRIEEDTSTRALIRHRMEKREGSPPPRH
jgi:hypothetical protein